MSEQVENRKMLKPLFLVKPGSVSRKDIARAEKHSGICIVECSEPETARYQELPMAYDLNDQARAALSLMRMVVSANTVDFKRGDLTKWFIDALLQWDKKPVNVTPTAQVKR
jgi:hypothetical protein